MQPWQSSKNLQGSWKSKRRRLKIIRTDDGESPFMCGCFIEFQLEIKISCAKINVSLQNYK